MIFIFIIISRDFRDFCTEPVSLRNTVLDYIPNNDTLIVCPKPKPRAKR